MRHPVAVSARLVTCLALALACSPQAQEPVAAQPESTALTAAAENPGLLLNIMVELGRDMGELSDALWLDDLATVATAAGAIAGHPHVAVAERERIQAALGADFPDFVKGDRRVHDSALRLAEHATHGDKTAVLSELGELQAGCVACHDAFRDRLAAPTP